MAKCVWCAEMVCGDANWCEVKERVYSDSYLYREHECKYFRDCNINAVTLMERRERKPKEDPYAGMERLVMEVD